MAYSNNNHGKEKLPHSNETKNTFLLEKLSILSSKIETKLDSGHRTLHEINFSHLQIHRNMQPQRNCTNLFRRSSINKPRKVDVIYQRCECKPRMRTNSEPPVEITIQSGNKRWKIHPPKKSDRNSDELKYSSHSDSRIVLSSDKDKSSATQTIQPKKEEEESEEEVEDELGEGILEELDRLSDEVDCCGDSQMVCKVVKRCRNQGCTCSPMLEEKNVATEHIDKETNTVFTSTTTTEPPKKKRFNWFSSRSSNNKNNGSSEAKNDNDKIIVPYGDGNGNGYSEKSDDGDKWKKNAGRYPNTIIIPSDKSNVAKELSETLRMLIKLEAKQNSKNMDSILAELSRQRNDMKKITKQYQKQSNKNNNITVDKCSCCSVCNEEKSKCKCIDLCTKCDLSPSKCICANADMTVLNCTCKETNVKKCPGCNRKKNDCVCSRCQKCNKKSNDCTCRKQVKCIDDDYDEDEQDEDEEEEELDDPDEEEPCCCSREKPKPKPKSCCCSRKAKPEPPPCCCCKRKSKKPKGCCQNEGGACCSRKQKSCCQSEQPSCCCKKKKRSEGGCCKSEKPKRCKNCCSSEPSSCCSNRKQSCCSRGSSQKKSCCGTQQKCGCDSQSQQQSCSYCNSQQQQQQKTCCTSQQKSYRNQPDENPWAKGNLQVDDNPWGRGKGPGSSGGSDPGHGNGGCCGNPNQKPQCSEPCCPSNYCSKKCKCDDRQVRKELANAIKEIQAKQKELEKCEAKQLAKLCMSKCRLETCLGGCNNCNLEISNELGKVIQELRSNKYEFCKMSQREINSLLKAHHKLECQKPCTQGKTCCKRDAKNDNCCDFMAKMDRDTCCSRVEAGPSAFSYHDRPNCKCEDRKITKELANAIKEIQAKRKELERVEQKQLTRLCISKSKMEKDCNHCHLCNAKRSNQLQRAINDIRESKMDQSIEKDEISNCNFEVIKPIAKKRWSFSFGRNKNKDCGDCSSSLKFTDRFKKCKFKNLG